MLRERMDAYLDGGLEPAERLALEAQLAEDPAAAKLLAGVKARRALRHAAYDSYLPTPGETRSLAQRLLSQAYDLPVGRIGYWVRRGAAVAAAIMIVTGTFTAGRMTATPQLVPIVETRTVYNVVYTVGGIQRMKDFATMDDRNKFVQELEQGGASGIAVADITMPGQL